MPVVNGYCTEAELRTWMSDTNSILSSDLLVSAINATSRAIDTYTGRRFWKDTSPTTRKYKVTEIDVAWVFDMSTSVGVIVKTDDIGDGLFSNVWASTDFELSPYDADVDVATPYAFTRIHAIGNKSFTTSERFRTLQVTASHGWNVIPDEVNQACLMKANMLVLRKDSPYGIAGFTEYGAVRIGRTEDPTVAQLLGPFMRSNVGAV